jgi:hypothetical protein
MKSRKASGLLRDRRGLSELIGFLIIMTAFVSAVTYILVVRGRQEATRAQGIVDTLREMERRQGELLSLVHAERSPENENLLLLYLYNYGSENVLLRDNGIYIAGETVTPAGTATGAYIIAWTLQDPDGDPQAGFQVQIGTSQGENNVWDTGQVMSSANYATYTGALTKGATYYIRIRVYDGYEWSGWLSGSFVA